MHGPEDRTLRTLRVVVLSADGRAPAAASAPRSGSGFLMPSDVAVNSGSKVRPLASICSRPPSSRSTTHSSVRDLEPGLAQLVGGHERGAAGGHDVLDHDDALPGLGLALHRLVGAVALLRPCAR